VAVDDGLAVGARHGCPAVVEVVGEAVLAAGHGGRQVCAGAGDADAVALGEAVLAAGHGGRQVCAGAGDADAVAVEVGDAVPVAAGMGTQVMVGVGAGTAGWDVLGAGRVGVGVDVVGDDVGRMVTLGQGVTTGFGAVAVAEAEAGRPAAGLPVAGLACFFTKAEVRIAAVVALAGARSEAGRALTPCRYASAMAVTMVA
jgi:hypothetical protein